MNKFGIGFECLRKSAQDTSAGFKGGGSPVRLCLLTTADDIACFGGSGSINTAENGAGGRFDNVERSTGEARCVVEGKVTLADVLIIHANTLTWIRLVDVIGNVTGQRINRFRRVITN